MDSFDQRQYFELGSRKQYSKLTTGEPDEPRFHPPKPRPHRVNNLFGIAFIVGGTLGGFVVALSHHFLNSYLNDRPVSEYKQQWVRAAGNAVAYVATTLMIVSGGAALKQSMWHTARRTTLSVASLNALFGLQAPWNLYRLELFTKAPRTVFICLIIAALPITPIIAPTSLTVFAEYLRGVPLPVPTVNLGRPMDIGAASLALVYYDGPSYIWRSAANRALINNGAIEWVSPCGPTCSYDITYVAPALRCSDITAAQIANNDNGTFNDPQQVISLRGWRANPYSLWVFNITHADSVTDYLRFWAAYMPFDSTVPSFSTENIPREPRGSYCVGHNATYTVNVRYNGGVQTTLVGQPEYHEPLDGRQMWDTWNNSGQGPNIPLVNLFSVYNAFTAPFGEVSLDVQRHRLRSEHEFAFTNLFEMNNIEGQFYFRPKFTNFSHALESLLGNITLAFMQLSNGEEVVPVSMMSPVKYRYYTTTLWYTYGAALAMASVCALIGLYCLWADGVEAKLDFAEFLATTRNPSIDRLLEHVYEGSDEMDESIWKTRLRYGRVGQSPRWAFGVVGVDEVSSIVRQLK